MSFESFNPSPTDNRLRSMQNKDSGDHAFSGAVSIPSLSANVQSLELPLAESSVTALMSILLII
jgi:hypothetical protein